MKTVVVKERDMAEVDATISEGEALLKKRLDEFVRDMVGPRRKYAKIAQSMYRTIVLTKETSGMLGLHTMTVALLTSYLTNPIVMTDRIILALEAMTGIRFVASGDEDIANGRGEDIVKELCDD